ncbi:radical SAM protein [Roseateles toxinivorans]|uniref:MoaA/NifB/PqqE/SkfB family radical SAM enzyme n=1 Tax=Roseateles toxinivorans TaxID=270368 RepID=A0A4R6QMX4_9BURK|nr:radical SAM protein [Roseateles toxinivorans]TDP71506.1 MoaA/NifB/PqqE/SkfB family radical SAM enzyme [Roseateles toxinivorans]
MSLADRLLQKIPQYTRNARHLRSVVQHGTPGKWANLARVEYERMRKRIQVASHPYLLIIDPCNFCNLRCPLCPTGLNDLGREQSMLSFEHFKHYFDPHAPYLFEAYLHNWGESLINKDVFRMIDYAQSRNVGTNLSSNMVIPTSDDLDQLIDSGLEYLVVSLDGATPETYSKYRIRGDFDRVLANMTELIRRRNARGKKTPVVEWQYIVMKPNEHEVAQAEAMAKKIGVDLIRFIPVGMPFEFRNRQEVADVWYPESVKGRKDSDGTEQQFGQAGKPGPCFYLYRSMVVNPDGGISPCCVVYRKNRDFGQLDPEQGIDLPRLWNSEKYQSARSLFSPEVLQGRKPTVCDTCDIFAYHPSKARPRRRPEGEPIQLHRSKS